ncbi:unnamed protein product [Dimorphilus gyrociliatus]|uniref:Uncharacterized protein n=1 Tax=Dimorphilus gyrociliatus TaxID=2664684 RepID=A0A7I8WDV8_9ANNE|nr:unnamed protein product [Dimorphilus gyrociliatus]
MQNYDNLKRDIEESLFCIEIRVYRKTNGVRHVGFAIFIDNKWKYTLDYEPVHYVLGLFGSRAHFVINVVSDEPRKMKTDGVQHKYTRNEYKWREKALSKIDELLKPINKTYRLLSTNCSNEIKQKLNNDDPAGKQIHKEAATIHTSMIATSFVALSSAVVIGAGVLISHLAKQDKEKNPKRIARR